MVYQHSFSQASSLLPSPRAHHCRSSSDSGCSQRCLTILIGTILVLKWVLYGRRFACRDSVTVRASGLRNDGYILPKELDFLSSAIKNLDNDKIWLVLERVSTAKNTHAVASGGSNLKPQPCLFPTSLRLCSLIILSRTGHSLSTCCLDGRQTEQRVFRHSDDTRVDDPLSGRRLKILDSTLWSDFPYCAGVPQHKIRAESSSNGSEVAQCRFHSAQNPS